MGLLGLVTVKINSQYLGTAGYGQYALVYEYLAFFGIIADLGLYTVAVKEMSQFPEKIEKVIGNVLTLRTILIAIAMIGAVLSIFFLPLGSYNEPQSLVPTGVLIASFTIGIIMFNGTITSVLQYAYKMHHATIASVLGKFITISLIAFIAFEGYPNDKITGFYLLIAAGIIGAVITAAYTYYHVRKIVKLRYQFDPALVKKLLKEAVPFGFALILSTIYFRIDSLLVSYMRGDTELGVYKPAMQLIEQAAVVSVYFMNTVLPVLTKEIKEKSQKVGTIIRGSFDVLVALSVPVVIGGFLLAFPLAFVFTAPEFLSDLGIGFYGTDIALKILIFAVFFQYTNTLFTFILISANRQAVLLFVNAAGVIFNITANLIFIPQYGFRAAALTTVFSEMLVLILSYILARQTIKFDLKFTNFFKVILSGLVMGALVYYLQPVTYEYLENWNVPLLVALGGLIYFGMLFLTKTINRDMLKLIRKK